MKNRKSIKVVFICLLVLILVGSGIAYTVYSKAGDYLLQETIGSQIETGFIQATGVDLSESGRVLSEEEVEKVETLLKAAQKIANASQATQEQSESIEEDEDTVSTTIDKSSSSKAQKDKQMTTDEAKEKLQTQATQVIKKIPAKDKNAMINLVLSNISMSDISYLASLATDGVSGSDIAEAKRIALRSFSKEEIERVRDYYYAYSYLIP